MTQKRTQKDLEINQETEKNRLSDAELDSTIVTFPKKTAKTDNALCSDPPKLKRDPAKPDAGPFLHPLAERLTW
jgi:hypothetical protein